MNEVWYAKLDDKYDCRVIRTDEYSGKLTVSEGDELLGEKDVPLSYGAMFGPDVDDIAMWEDFCLSVVDKVNP